MAPKKKRKKEDGDAELEQEALAEWLARGLAAPDFTLDKMLRLWAEEDDGGEDDEDGEDALAAKQELIQQSYNVLAPALAQAKELASDLRDSAVAEAKHLWAIAKHHAEIPPLQRRRLLRDHVRDVRAMDAESDKYARIRRRFAAEFEHEKSASAELQFGLKKRNTNRAPLLSRVREMKSAADAAQVARIQEDAERERQARADRELHEKQRAREAKEQLAAEQLAHRRQMNVRFWRKQHADAKAFSEQQVRAQEVARESAERAELLQREVEHMARAESDDAQRDLERDPTRSSIGVFDTALAPGEWSSAVDGGHRVGLDEHTIGVASARGYIAEHEVTRLELSEAQSKVLMLREKLEQAAQAKAELLQDRSTVYERRDKVLDEIAYISAEYDELSQTLAGPPRRDPSEDDKMQFHVLVSRKAAQMKQLAAVDARLENLRRREQIAERSERVFAPQLSEAQECEARLQEAVEQFEAQRHDLPMVVGRSIFKPSVDELNAGDAAETMATDVDAEASVTELFADPNALLTRVTMQSKLELLKSAAIPAREHYKAARRLAAESWAWSERKVLAQQELEVTKTRLAAVRDRFVEQHRSGLRADLAQAILRYHQGGNRLRRCVFPLKGFVEWWEQRVPTKSFGVAFSDALGGVHLVKPLTSGQFRGSFRFPKRGSYRLELQVRLQRLDEPDAAAAPAADGAEEEADTASQALRDLKVYIGSDFDALREFTFRDPGGKAVRTGSLAFEYFGSRLCYCFEFSLRSELAWREALQFVVSHVGSYEERLEDFRDEEQRMRRHQQEHHFTSELVKTLRLQSKQTSSERCTDLLQELLDVDQSRAKTWDSKLLHGHTQRFDRSEYAKMLRAEIKKEVTRQIDHDVLARKARGVTASDSVGDAGQPDARSSVDASRWVPMSPATRVSFSAGTVLLTARAAGTQRELHGTQVRACRAPAPEGEGDARRLLQLQERRAERARSHVASVITSSSSRFVPEGVDDRGAALRVARSEVEAARDAQGSEEEDCQPRASRSATADAVDEWHLLDGANAVLLASAFAAAIRTRREEEREARTLTRKKDEQLRTLQAETLKTVVEAREAEQRERDEDRALLHRKAADLARRRTKLHWDALRLTTYNESVAAQIDFQARRRANALAQHDGGSSAVSLDAVAAEVKAEFAAQFVDGRLALANKTWERRAKRVADERESERRERAFRIRQESALAEAITAENERAVAELHTAKTSAELQLRIPSFELAVQGQFPCDHRDVKSWGSKYDAGMRCKRCGKEMAKSFDEPHHTRGADPELDFDVEAQRRSDAGGPPLRVTSAAHRERVDAERLRLEKEARALQLTDAVLYDRAAPKAIDALNFRHGLDRGLAFDAAGSDPTLYARVVHETHRAAFQDTVLFHGRLRNFHVRLQQLGDLHARVTTQLAVERDFLESVTAELAFVAETLPLVERDHARAVRLLSEDADALARLEAARAALSAAQRERAAASHAIAGVEEDAEFAEFHVPALVASSDAMRAVLERVQAQHRAVEQEVAAADAQLARANERQAATDGLLSRLLLRTPGAVVRTAFGFAAVVYFREADSCVVLSPLRWRGMFFFAAATLVAYEDAFREAERVAMAAEERAQREFGAAEKRLAARELALMRGEDAAVRTITRWRAVQERDEATARRALEDTELALQLEYELAGRKRSFDAAGKEAKHLSAVARVSLKRRQRVGSSRLDLVRVTRACEKRLAMASVEAALAGADVALRAGFAHARDELMASELAAEVFAELLAEITREVSATTLDESVYTAKQLLRSLSTAIVPLSESWTTVCTHTLLGVDRVWAARKKKHEVLQATWQHEAAKLRVLEAEVARRAEIRRLEEEERARLELRRKAMLAEERRCRQFYVDEMVRLVQERKAMARAELEMREYARQLELEAMKAKYAKAVEDRSHASDKAARRLEIKLGKNEQHRLHREWALIKDEDALATQLREHELAAARADALERQFDRFLVQQAVDGKVAAALEASRLQERVREAQRLAAEQRAAFEAKLAQERMVATVAAFCALASAEVEWMQAVERAAYWLRQLAPLASTLEKLRPELERILVEREHVVADARLKREHAAACQERLGAATRELERAIELEGESSRVYRKLHLLNCTMDSEVLHGRPQRFKTTYLREQLHDRYFLLLTESIVRRAVVEYSEREVARLEEKLRQLHAERVTKSTEVARLKRKHRRAFHLSLRRAALGGLLFGGSQRRVLKDTFQRWAKLWSQRVTVRAAFELKHSLLLQQHQLRVEPTEPAKFKNELGATKLSVMRDHQRRRVQCRLCKREYSEEQNNRFACSYHPAAYELACVRTCASRRVEGGAVSASCMMHRARRWLCCDATEEGQFGSNGCARRFHMPTRASPALEQLVATKARQEKMALEQLEQQLLELRERDVVGNARAGAKTVVTKIERDLAEKRSVAASFHALDRR